MLFVAVVICMGVTTVTLLLPALGATAAAALTVTVTTPATCTAHTMQVVAHPDDDLLFMNPDILRDIEAGHCVRTVFVTTGDAARDDSYWPRREEGIRAAYAIMAGADDAWTETTIAIAGNDLTTVTLDAAPAISLVFMRLPDGNRRGTGNRIHDFESLKRPWEGDIPTISAVDGTATYDRESLQRTLTGLMDDFEASTVRTQNWTIEFGAGDNADHTATALFVREAAQMSPTEHTLAAYPERERPRPRRQGRRHRRLCRTRPEDVCRAAVRGCDRRLDPCRAAVRRRDRVARRRRAVHDPRTGPAALITGAHP